MKVFAFLIILIGVNIVVHSSFSEKRDMQKQKAYATPVSDVILSAFDEVQEIPLVVSVILPAPECSWSLQASHFPKKDSGQRYSPT